MKYVNPKILLLCSFLSFANSFVYADEVKHRVVPAPEGGFNQGSDQEAERKEKKESKNKWLHFVGNAGFVSNYVFRGQTQTFGGPAVQGEMKYYIGPAPEEGFYVGMFGSNVDSTTATNGSGLELDLLTGYIYKVNKDLSFKLELLNTRYPGAYAPLDTKDSFDVLEIYPAVTYKYITVYWSYSFTNVRGVNQNFAPEFYTPLQPNGSSKGSWYTEALLKLPIVGTEEKLKLIASVGYQYVRNYTTLNYTTYSVGMTYQIPERYGGLLLTVCGCATNAKKRYYTVVNDSGQSKNLVAPKVWVGVSKEF